MKIISNFSDVYDQCAMYGIDEDTVYRRFIEAERVRLEGDFSPMARHVNAARSHSHWYERQLMGLRTARTGTTSIMFLVVGEHVIPHVGGTEVRCHFRGTGSGETFYTAWRGARDVEAITQPEDILSPLGRVFASYQEFATVLGLSASRPASLRRRGEQQEGHELLDYSAHAYFMEDAMSADELMTPFKDERWARAIGAPLAVVIPAVVDREAAMRKDLSPKEIGGAIILRNPSIKLLGLTSLMDPYTLHQEISMAMNGFLSDQHDGTDSISDSDRAKAKGFDEVSFKTRKGTKKPRRKKDKQNV